MLLLSLDFTVIIVVIGSVALSMTVSSLRTTISKKLRNALLFLSSEGSLQEAKTPQLSHLGHIRSFPRRNQGRCCTAGRFLQAKHARKHSRNLKKLKNFVYLLLVKTIFVKIIIALCFCIIIIIKPVPFVRQAGVTLCKCAIPPSEKTGGGFHSRGWKTIYTCSRSVFCSNQFTEN